MMSRLASSLCYKNKIIKISTFPKVLDSTKFTDETYILLSRMYDAILNDRLSEPSFKHIDRRQKFMKLLGITEHAAKRAIHIYNNPSEASERKEVDQPHQFL